MCALLILYLRIFLYFLFIISQPYTIALLHGFCSGDQWGASLFVFLTFSKPLNPEPLGLQLFPVIWEILVLYGDLGHNYKPGYSTTNRVQQFQQVSFSGHLCFPFCIFSSYIFQRTQARHSPWIYCHGWWAGGLCGLSSQHHTMSLMRPGRVSR